MFPPSLLFRAMTQEERETDECSFCKIDGAGSMICSAFILRKSSETCSIVWERLRGRHGYEEEQLRRCTDSCLFLPWSYIRVSKTIVLSFSGLMRGREKRCIRSVTSFFPWCFLFLSCLRLLSISLKDMMLLREYFNPCLSSSEETEKESRERSVRDILYSTSKDRSHVTQDCGSDTDVHKDFLFRKRRGKSDADATEFKRRTFLFFWMCVHLWHSQVSLSFRLAPVTHLTFCTP